MLALALKTIRWQKWGHVSERKRTEGAREDAGRKAVHRPSSLWVPLTKALLT